MNRNHFTKKIISAIISLICICPLLQAQAPFPLKPIDEHRVKEIMPMLKDRPAGYGDPCNKREVWDKLLQSGKYDQFLKEMETFTFPAFSKEDYFSLADGTAPSSARGLTMMRNRAKGLSQATWAECLENKGRYVKVVEDGLRDIINQKSWVSPRNDFGFKNYNGVEYSVELTTALYAHTIAQTLYMMGDKLSADLRKDAVAEIRKRAFDPVLNKIKTQNDAPENRFIEMTNNYNHVCLSGVVGAALTVLEDKYERAVFAYIGEYYSQNGLKGFGDDGYCSEGVGYYNYGFGHYVMLRESLWQATGGKSDLFTAPKVLNIAWYPINIQIINGVSPAISDSRVGAKPDAEIMYYVSRNFGMGLTEYDNLTFEGQTDGNRISVMMVFPNSASANHPAKKPRSEEQIIRSFFDRSSVLVSRPLPGTPCNMGVAFKGGNNAEHHNHNDVGSYTVALGDEIMAGDPGSIPYTADIFNPKFRYTYKTVGSYGHPVPLPAGKEQRPGADAKAEIVKTDFTRNKDILVMNIASAYDVPELKKLQRSMEYGRKGTGYITVTDDFAFATPQSFETAVVTRSSWKKLSDDTILLESEKGNMQVTFTAPKNKLAVRSEEITEGGTPYTRIGIYLEKPAAAGKIVVTYRPGK